MGKINILNQNLINKIAAGEVVERPASIVKELIENSIDAKSAQITISIENSGVGKINIVDNGEGIDKSEISKAFLPHATSKINTEDDLSNILTLGFRGEALASIASVSKVRLISKTKSSEVGNEIIIEGGKIISEKETSFQNGTSITISDLFYNTPARRKFLKSANTEYSYIQDIVTKFILSNPNIHFIFINNKKLIGNYIKQSSAISRVEHILHQSSDDLIELNYKHKIDISGYIGKAHIGIPSRSRQYIFVNNRPVENSLIAKAVGEAYPNLLMNKKYPIFVLSIKIPPDLVDVNVHPRKTEVKFQNTQEIFIEVKNAVYSAFKNTQLITPNKDNLEFEDPNIYKSGSLNKPLRNDVQEALNFTRQILQKQENPDNNILEEYPIDNTDKGISKADQLESLFEKGSDVDTSTLHNTNSNFGKIEQFLNKYIVFEMYGELHIMDQHAAAERILYEKYLKQLKNESLNIQTLLIPLGIKISLKDMPIIEENIDLLEKMGIEITLSANDEITLNGLPFELETREMEKLIADLISILKDVGTIDKKHINTELQDRLAASLACHSAIKFGDKLSDEEIIALINDLYECQTPFTCPHGRPTIHTFKSLDLEKLFKRV